MDFGNPGTEIAKPLTEEEIKQINAEQRDAEKRLRESVRGKNPTTPYKQCKNPDGCPMVLGGQGAWGSIPGTCYWICHVRPESR